MRFTLGEKVRIVNGASSGKTATIVRFQDLAPDFFSDPTLTLIHVVVDGDEGDAAFISLWPHEVRPFPSSFTS